MYDKRCRSLPPHESAARVSAGETHVVRMSVPEEGEVTFHDEVRGTVTIACNAIDDQVLLKSDGFPTYHLAVVVDDHSMEISHVIRGEEWLPSTPKHVLLYRFFGWELPKFAHLPLLLNPDKSKLSKRQGDVAVEDYRAKGYLKESLINFVAFLGWNPGDERELFTLEELIAEFSLARVGKAGAVFNIEKLNWMNQQHIKRKSDAELLPLVQPLFRARGWENFSDDYCRQVIGLLKERVVVLNDFPTAAVYFFEEPAEYDDASRAKNWKPETGGHLQLLNEKLGALPVFDAASIESALRSAAEQLQVGAGKLIHPMRLALSGVSNGPSLFHLAEVLGKERVTVRIAAAIRRLS